MGNDFQILVKALIQASDLQGQLTALQDKLKPLKINLDLGGLKSGSLSGVSEQFKTAQKAAGDYQKYLAQLSRENEKFGRIQKQASDRISANAAAYRTLQYRISGLTQQQRDQLRLEERLRVINSTTDLVQRGKEIRYLTNDIQAASRGMNTFAATIEYTIERFVQIGLTLLVFRQIKNAISSMITSVKELDKSLVEVQKVTNLTGNSLETFTKQAYDVGATVARTGKEVIDATAIFARSGYEIKDALDLAEVAMVMMNVGDGIDNTATAAASLISVLKGYNLEAEKAMDITSLINEVSNNAAINFADLTEGLTRTSAVFSQAGVEMGNLAGLLTGGQEILNNIEKVSTGLVTLNQRLRGLTDIGEDGAVATSKLSKEFKSIANIDIFDPITGQLRDTYSILEDTARVFPTLTANQRQYLGELSAGQSSARMYGNIYKRIA